MTGYQVYLLSILKYNNEGDDIEGIIVVSTFHVRELRLKKWNICLYGQTKP